MELGIAIAPGPRNSFLSDFSIPPVARGLLAPGVSSAPLLLLLEWLIFLIHLLGLLLRLFQGRLLAIFAAGYAAAAPFRGVRVRPCPGGR